MGTNCAPLVADLFSFCYERDFMLSLSENNQADVVEAFNSTSRYLDDLLYIDNPYFAQMVFSKFYYRHSELIVQYNICLKIFCNKAYQNLYF